MLYVIFFMTLYRELIHKLHGLRRILDEFDDLSLDTHSKTGYKKKFAELKEEYDSTKDDYKKKYNLITPLHKLS
ncbi:hypothetical protein KAZ93_01265 [Patescibacteria group bacterium]|nr:hypothetical protein [Patescibacteria group bacterium]